jgi:hypothetical protein
MAGLLLKMREPRQTAIRNVSVIAEKLRALNPNAEIVMQTVYNPFELSPEDRKRYSESTLSKYETLMNYVNNNVQQVNNAIALTEGIRVADVSGIFSGSGWLYDRVQEKDVLPTPLGHAMIAAAVAETLGDACGNSAKLRAFLTELPQSLTDQIPADDLAALRLYADAIPQEEPPAVTTASPVKL